MLIVNVINFSELRDLFTEKEKMNFAQAVKGRITRSLKLQTIRSSAQTELGRDIAEAEENILLQNIGLNELYDNVQKVTEIFCT